MLEECAYFGKVGDDAYDLTFREIYAASKSRMRVREESVELALVTAWHTANYSRARKRLPDLKKQLEALRKKKSKPQTLAQQRMMVEFLNAVFSGEDHRPERQTPPQLKVIE